MNTFIGDAIEEMVSDGVSVEFTKKLYSSKFGYNYFFADNNKKIFKINYYSNDLKKCHDIFLHEYCHYKQWKETPDFWNEKIYFVSLFNNWIMKKSEIISETIVRNTQLLELDCDKRALNLIKKYKLPIDKKSYILSSNVYILSYNILYKDRKLFNHCPYDVKDVQKEVPKHHINENELSFCSEPFITQFNKYCNAR